MRTSLRKPWAAVVVGATALGALVATAAPSQAADTWSCNTTGYILGNDATTTGTLWRYPVTKAGTTSAVVGARISIGTGWSPYWIHAGGSGYIWGWKSDGTLFAWRYDAATNKFTMPATQLKGPDGVANVDFGSTSDTSDRLRAVDANNNIFVIDGNGVIMRYRYDFATKKWPIYREVVDTGFVTTTYDQLWTSDGAAIYARTKAGDLYRFRYDDTSRRLVGSRVKVGSGWQIFKKNFSIGGDVNVAVKPDPGALFHYRHNESAVSPEPSWPVSGDQVGTSGWDNFRTVTGFADACRRTNTVVTNPNVQITQNSPVVAASTSTKKVYLSYADNIGRLWWGYIPSTADMTPQWSAIHGTTAFAGPPAVVDRGAQKVSVYGHSTTGTVLAKEETTAGGGVPGDFLDHGGAMLGAPTAVDLSTGETVLAATDEQGSVWVRMQYGASGYGEFRAWEKVAAGVAAPGSHITLADAGSGVARMYVTTAAGGVSTSTYSTSRAKTPWVDLGLPGAGAQGRLSVVTYPGMAQRVFVTDTAGAVHTRRQDSAMNWDAGWSAVDGTTAVVGSASAVIAPNSGLVEVVARNAAGQILFAQESAQGSGTFNAFKEALPGDPTVYVADPTPFVYSTDLGQAWGITSYPRPGEVYIYRLNDAANRSAGPVSPTFSVTKSKVHPSK